MFSSRQRWKWRCAWNELGVTLTIGTLILIGAIGLAMIHFLYCVGAKGKHIWTTNGPKTCLGQCGNETHNIKTYGTPPASNYPSNLLHTSHRKHQKLTSRSGSRHHSTITLGYLSGAEKELFRKNKIGQYHDYRCLGELASTDMKWYDWSCGINGRCSWRISRTCVIPFFKNDRKIHLFPLN